MIRISGDFNLKSIRFRLMIPFALILFLQTGILMLFILKGGVADDLQKNAVALLSRDAESSEMNVEREMVQYWMNSIKTADQIRMGISAALEKRERIAADIRRDPDLNQEKITPGVIELLHRSYGNTVSVVLDGPASVQTTEGQQAGLCILDMDSSSHAADNSDLLLLYGNAAISRQFGISLDSYWSLGVSIQEENPETAYYPQLISYTREHPVSAQEAGDYGYLSTDGKGGIRYSLPIVLEDGTVVGVLSGGMNAEHVREIMQTVSNSGSSSAISMLARMDPDKKLLIPAVTGGTIYDRYFGDVSELKYRPGQGEESVGTVTDLEHGSWYFAAVPLEVYENNAPFAGDLWAVIRLERSSSMMAFNNQIYHMIMISLVVSMLLSVLAVLVVANVIFNPIRRLSDELKQVEIKQGISLKRTHIREIDELIIAIEQLSAEVVESSSRVGRILNAAGVLIGAFEMNDAISQKVYCSKSVFDILGWERIHEDYRYLDVTEFHERMEKLPVEEYDEEGNKIFRIFRGRRRHYVRLKMVRVGRGGLTGVLSDITMDIEERKKLERERNFDLLTGIYNRRAFREQACHILYEEKTPLAALVMWDLDNLKYVNDTYGHDMGDTYIRMFADQLRTLLAGRAVIKRHSGDEFMALLYDETREEIQQRIHDFMNSLKSVVMKIGDDGGIPLRASAGVAWYPAHSDQLELLEKYADFAMYIAKHSKKGVVQEFDMNSYKENAYLISGREELNNLLERREVRFALQPIVARDGRIYGYEALMRPQLKNFKNIQEVLTLARDQAKLPQFEYLTWYGALNWIGRQQHLCDSEVRFFINSIASTTLRPEEIREVETLFPNLLKRIVLEITEMEPVDDHGMNAKLQTLKDWGGLLALDDFGSGYNGENVLLQLHPDLVKLDIQMVQNIQEDPGRQTLIANLVKYCHSRGILVIAEGVEELPDLEVLMGLQVDLFQGYYLGRPEFELRPLNSYVEQVMKNLNHPRK